MTQMESEVSLEYVSVGCNRTPHCVDWAPTGLLAYGADRSIALAKESCVCWKLTASLIYW